jgi:hypothetical protein
LILRDKCVVRAEVGPGTAAVTDRDADVGVARIDPGEFDVGVPGPLVGERADSLLDVGRAVQEADAKLTTGAPHSFDRKGKAILPIVRAGVAWTLLEGEARGSVGEVLRDAAEGADLNRLRHGAREACAKLGRGVIVMVKV